MQQKVCIIQHILFKLYAFSPHRPTVTFSCCFVCLMFGVLYTVCTVDLPHCPYLCLRSMTEDEIHAVFSGSRELPDDSNVSKLSTVNLSFIFYRSASVAKKKKNQLDFLSLIISKCAVQDWRPFLTRLIFGCFGNRRSTGSGCTGGTGVAPGRRPRVARAFCTNQHLDTQRAA